MNLKSILFSLLFFTLGGVRSFAATGGPDTFGYTFIDSASPGGPAYQWIDISQTGATVLSGFSPDEASTVELPSPVVLYGTVSHSIRVSANGYLGTALSDAGADDSNDCPLPAQASSGSGARLYACHDDLDFGGGFDSKVLHQYFPASPHPHHGCGVNVFSWQNVRHAGGGVAIAFSFQVLVFDNFDILIQFEPGNPERGSGSTTGLQNGAATLSGLGGFGASGLGYACDTLGSLPGAAAAGLAVLFEPPVVTVNSTLDAIPTSVLATSLREALRDAPAGARIAFDPSLAGQEILRDPALGVLLVDKALAVDAFPLFLSGHFAINGNDAAALMTVAANTHFFMSTVVLRRGLTTANPGSGGLGMRENTSGSFHDVSFYLHHGNGGAALRLNDNARAVLTKCNFWANESGNTNGGAIYAGEGSNLLIDGGVFWDDAAVYGGSIYGTFSSAIEIEGAIFAYDTATNTGGSIHSSGTLIARDCKFDDCGALRGGAISSNGQGTLERCSFFSNTSTLEGGAVSNYSGILTVTNCTFGDNRSDSLGIGISIGIGFGGAVQGFGNGTTTLLHSTFVGNSEEAVIAFAGHTLAIGHCLFQDNTASGAPGSIRSLGAFTNLGYNLCDHDEAEFGPLTNDLENTDAAELPAAANGLGTFSYALGATSPARDAGNPAFLSPPATDQRGLARVQGGRIDIGAVEFVGEIIVTTNIDEIADPGAGLSLREALALADPGTTLVFAAGLSGTTINLATGVGTQIVLEKDLSIDASALPAGIRVSGGNQMRAFEILGAAVNLTNLTLVDGYAEDALYSSGTGGGAIRVGNASTVTMNGGAVRRCLSDSLGGGVHTSGASAFIAEGVEFTGNETLSSQSGGGAVQIGSTCLGTLRRCALIGNSASVNSGGAIYAQSLSLLEINGSTIANNTSKNGGGALALENDTYLDMANNTLSGNEAGVGATGNAGGGALLALVGASGNIRHCTIANNRQKTGAGIEISNNLGSSFAIGHTILSGNTNPASEINLNGNTRVTSLGYNLTTDATVGTPPNSTDRVNRTAYLAPLANYGGLLETHALLAISPAIDGGDPFIIDAPAKDARRFARIADGDRNGAATIDIGAVEAKRPFIVNHDIDETTVNNLRSLREGILAATSGDRIVFNASLNNATINLSAAEGGLGSQLTVGTAVQIDATRLPGGLNVSGGDTVRVFGVNATGNLALHAVSVIDGFAGTGSNGGGVRVLGSLLATHSCLEGNRAQLGGGIAVEASGSARLFNVTLSDNGAFTSGGALALIDTTARARLDHCTVARNFCNGAGAGGLALSGGTLVLSSSIVAENTTGGNFGISNPANYATQLDSRGYNLTNEAAAPIVVAFDGPGDLTSTAPNLLPLINAAGWAKIHPFFAGSPAKDSGNPDRRGLPVMDSRGFVRVVPSAMDIGAAEFGGESLDSDNDQIPDWWELRHGFLPHFNADAGEDADGDGTTNLAEYNAGTDPHQPDVVPAPADPRITAFALDPLTGNLEITVTTDPGAPYTLKSSEDLQQWNGGFQFTGNPGHTVLLVPAGFYGGLAAPFFYFRIERGFPN